MADKRMVEILGNDGKYYRLNYTHDEIEDLLKRVATGGILTITDYEKLMELGVDNLSVFTGYYDDLLDKPDFDLLQKTVDDLCNCSGGSLLQQRLDDAQEDIATIQANLIEEIRKVTEQQYAIQGDFVSKSEILKLSGEISNLANQIENLRLELGRIESLCYNKSNIGHTHNASEMKIGGKSLDACLALKSGIDHTHADFEYHIDDIDDNCVELTTKFNLFTGEVEDDYQKKEDVRITGPNKNIVDAINELYQLYSTLINK